MNAFVCVGCNNYLSLQVLRAAETDATQLFNVLSGGNSANVTRTGVDGAQALRYILSLKDGPYRPSDWRPANPSHLLAVLLLFGNKLGLGTVWDLRPLDRKSSVFFIPEDYRDFGYQVIQRGMNHTHRIGFGVWRLSDFHTGFQQAMKIRFDQGTPVFPKEGAALCGLSSLLFPDRVPLVFERILSIKTPSA